MSLLLPSVDMHSLRHPPWPQESAGTRCPVRDAPLSNPPRTPTSLTASFQTSLRSNLIVPHFICGLTLPEASGRNILPQPPILSL
ncbi:hypothetical protein CC2G_000080 [Coprinopsis cinerea AmutBmut pab1-1]|nr:hypothetical protein CC2G_000080 [Coprinopsis cinerea AmutBmut pab1-1]